MKKTLLTLALLLTPLCVLAEDTEVNIEEEINKQLMDIENAGGMILFQKQPSYQKQIQVIKIRKSGGIAIIQLNGKTDIDKKANK